MSVKIQRDELLEEIRRLADGDEPPREKDMVEKGAYSHTVYKSRFGCWNDAVEAAGFTPRSSTRCVSDGELIEEIQRLADGDSPPTSVEMQEDGEYSSAVYQARFGSWGEALRAAGFEPQRRGSAPVPTDELLFDLCCGREFLGFWPKCHDYQALGEYSSSTVSARFGSWEEGIEAAKEYYEAKYEEADL